MSGRHSSPSDADKREALMLRKKVRARVGAVLSLPGAQGNEAAALKLAVMGLSPADADRVLSVGASGPVQGADNAALTAMQKFVHDSKTTRPK
jgi:hypothetical protein